MVIVKRVRCQIDVELKARQQLCFPQKWLTVWNIFEVSSLFEIAERGQVFLIDDQVACLNQELQNGRLCRGNS